MNGHLLQVKDLSSEDGLIKFFFFKKQILFSALFYKLNKYVFKSLQTLITGLLFGYTISILFREY